MLQRKQVATVEEVGTRLEEWRQGRWYKRAAIPDELWSAAVEVARRDGLGRTAAALRLDYGHAQTADDGDRDVVLRRPATVGVKSDFLPCRSSLSVLLTGLVADESTGKRSQTCAPVSAPLHRRSAGPQSEVRPVIHPASSHTAPKLPAAPSWRRGT